jgi:hypothetical protein
LAGSSNRVLGGLAIALLCGVGAASIVTARSWLPGRLMIVGGMSMVAGLVLTVIAVAVSAPILFFVATAVTGVGFGIGWLGVLRSLVGLAAPTSRGALLAAIFIVAYLAFAVPAVAAGFGVTRVGLHQAALVYGAAIGLLAVVGLVATVLVGRQSRVDASVAGP